VRFKIVVEINPAVFRWLAAAGLRALPGEEEIS
jgi:hypothetical protein